MFYYTGGVTTNGSSAVYGATSGHVRTNYQGRVSHPTSLGQLRIKAGRNNSQNVFMCRWCKHDLDCRVAKLGRLSTKDAVLFLCDMQEKFRPNIFQFTNIVSNASRLLQASCILGIPQILTEQYPKGLGPTVPELGAGDLTAHAKTSFTMITEEVEKELQALGNRTQVILCGIEAHACIACTTFDLIEKGIEVHIVADAVSSRSQTDRLFALSRLKQSGAYLTTTEAVLLQLVQDAKHPSFKEIQKLLAHPSPDTGLLAFFSAL